MRRALICVSLLAVAGCSDAVSPTTTISGAWHASAVETSMMLTLTQDGGTITGTGSYTRFINPPNGTFTITGTYAPPQVDLTFSYDYGVTTHYVGTVRGADSIVGMESLPGVGADSLTFTRQVQPE